MFLKVQYVSVHIKRWFYEQQMYSTRCAPLVTYMYKVTHRWCQDNVYAGASRRVGAVRVTEIEPAASDSVRSIHEVCPLPLPSDGHVLSLPSLGVFIYIVKRAMSLSTRTTVCLHGAQAIYLRAPVLAPN